MICKNGVPRTCNSELKWASGRTDLSLWMSDNQIPLQQVRKRQAKINTQAVKAGAERKTRESVQKHMKSFELCRISDGSKDTSVWCKCTRAIFGWEGKVAERRWEAIRLI